MTTTTADQQNIKDVEMDVIRDFVYRFREQRGINPVPYEQMSQSGEQFGEGLVTLYQCLIPVTEGFGVWRELDDNEIRQMVLKQVFKDQYVLRK